MSLGEIFRTQECRVMSLGIIHCSSQRQRDVYRGKKIILTLFASHVLVVNWVVTDIRTELFLNQASNILHFLGKHTEMSYFLLNLLLLHAFIKMSL